MTTTKVDKTSLFVFFVFIYFFNAFAFSFSGPVSLPLLLLAST